MISTSNQLIAMVRSFVTDENINAYVCYDSQGNKITDDSFINQWVKITEN